MWKRWLIFVICLLLIIARFVEPKWPVDSTTVLLVGVASAMIFLPGLRALMPYVKRRKLGEAEIELNEEIRKLADEVTKTQEETPNAIPASKESIEKSAQDVDRILGDASRDPRAALLLLSSKIEQGLRHKLVEADVDIGGNYSMVRLADLAVKNRLLSEAFQPAIRDFSNIRNRVAHGKGFDVDDGAILSIISLGAELLKALY